jgi:plastocyanin
MKRILGIVLAVALVVVVAFVIFGAVSLNSSGTGSDVSLQLFFFHPHTLTVSAGTTVTWTDKDFIPHNVIGDGWASGAMGYNDTFTHTFATPGTYNYRCTHHFWMKGRVIVTP